MKAVVGDRMVVAAARLDGPVRDGEVVSTGPDGGPPYHVRWSDTGTESLFFPGPDAHIQHFDHPSDVLGTPTPTAPVPDHVKSWHVDLFLYEGQHATSAQAVLHGDAPGPVKSLGVARRRAEDPDVPEVGDEVAVSRALRRLADMLLGSAEEDLSEIAGRPVEIVAS